MQTHTTLTRFQSSESWSILSDIERSIKAKVEAIGIPLKNWDVKINYGIKTGFNDAFIIDSVKRKEILDACQSDEERNRTADIIRPILRGRDIKRYGYEWANMYLISTFPARHYDIEKYPAVKDYLLSFAYESLIEDGYDWIANNYLAEYCQKKLEQTGQDIVINGKYIVDQQGHKDKSRKKTFNKWFETQDSISYWDEFSRPKIIWKRVGSIIRFSYDEEGVLGLDSTCFATGKDISYLCCILNSSMGHYLLKDAPRTGTGDLLISVQAVEPLKVPRINGGEERFDEIVKRAIAGTSNELDNEIDNLIFDLYGLSADEREFIVSNFR